MDICIFYSWQSKYRNCCDKIISKALDKAVKKLNQEQDDYQYYIERGGGDVLGAEHIDNNIDEVIKRRADIAFVDFTHNGNIPQRNAETGEWVKEKCMPNTNVVYENGKLEVALNARQVFKIYNIAYGDLNTNLEMPFDLRQEHFPIPFFCDDNVDDEARKEVINSLMDDILRFINKGTKEFLDNQKVRYAPLVPMRNEYAKKIYQSPFKHTEKFKEIYEKINNMQSFRLLGLPGLGKTRMIGEAFRGKDNDVYYCDCKEQSNRYVLEAIEKLLSQRGNKRQVIILDNCSQKLCGLVNDTINENGYNCQLITIHYDPREDVDSGIDTILLRVEHFDDVVKAMVEDVPDIPSQLKESIISLAGGFPLMAKIMIENHFKGLPIVNISIKDVFLRLLGIDPLNEKDQDKMKVFTAFSIFKFIGLYGQQEKQGRFIAGNRIITNIYGSEDDNLQLFKEVFGQYQQSEILERQGNLVLMRLIPLAVFLCKSWFGKQTTDSIADLINQIRSCPDEGTRNMLIESLSRRIVLLSEVPLAKELNDGLTNPDYSPFLSEEVVLSALGSRLFLAFSEVNPESCAIALYRMISNRTDEQIKSLGSIRRNLVWALDHLAFDKRSFRNAMLTLARFSLVETDVNISNNSTGLFLDRFSILLPGTEVNLMTRLEVLKELQTDNRYNDLINKALHRALKSSNFHRSGGAEKQGTKTLSDYNPLYQEVADYFNACLDMLIKDDNTRQDVEDIAKTLATNARGYYIQGFEDFLFSGLEKIAPKKDFIWEEMNDALSFIIDYDAKKRYNHRISEIEAWRNKLTKDDYVYRLLHLGKEISRHYDGSYIEENKKIREQYDEMAKELVNKKMYKDLVVMSNIMMGECFYYNGYGMMLSSYSKEVGTQKELLDAIIDQVLHQKVSHDGESLLIYYMINVEDRELIDHVYSLILGSNKKFLLPALYAIKSESNDKLAQLFDLLDKKELTIQDFAGYFNCRAFHNLDVKYVVNRLLNYGSEAAELILSCCHNLLFDEKEQNEDYIAIGRKCLMLVDLKGIQKNDYIYMHSMNNYLLKHRDEEMALHIQTLLEKSFFEEYLADNYYWGRLYRKVLNNYLELLKPRLFEVLEDETLNHRWIDLMRTCYPQDSGEDYPIYLLISVEEWFDWLRESSNNKRPCALAMMFNYSNGNKVNPAYLKLLDEYWSDEVRDALSSRLHSFSWVGSGIPLYKSRIAICKDYIAKLSNPEVIAWFHREIGYWEDEIEKEIIQNAHERAIYD